MTILSRKDDVQSALTWLRRHGTRRTRDEMAPRYGIHTSKAFGVTMANMKVLARRLGRNHELAAALWNSGWYEARMLASFVDGAGASRPHKWTAGVATSTTGASVTRCCAQRGRRDVARRLADSPQAAARWVGEDALRELTSPAVIWRLAARRQAS